MYLSYDLFFLIDTLRLDEVWWECAAITTHTYKIYRSISCFYFIYIGRSIMQLWLTLNYRAHIKYKNITSLSCLVLFLEGIWWLVKCVYPLQYLVNSSHQWEKIGYMQWYRCGFSCVRELVISSFIFFLLFSYYMSHWVFIAKIKQLVALQFCLVQM